MEEVRSHIQEREVWIDNAKAILIFLMVFAHAHSHGLLGREWFHTFHMPAFFIISGYLYAQRNIFKTTRSLLFPLLIYSVVNLCYQVLMSYKTTCASMEDFANYISLCYQPMFVTHHSEYHILFLGEWFLIVLFLCRCIMGDIPWLRKMVDYKWHILILSVVGACCMGLFGDIGSIEKWHVVKVMSCLPFFVFGMIVKTYRKDMLHLKLSVLATLFICYIAMLLANGNIDMYYSLYGKEKALFYVNAVVVSLLFFNLCNKFNSCTLKKAIELWSKGTLVILGLHNIIMNMVAQIMKRADVLHYIGEDIRPLFMAIIVMIACLPIINWSLKKCPILCGK